MPSDIDEIEREAHRVSQQIRRQRDRLLSDHHLYSRLFFAPDGEPSAAAIEWLDNLGKRCFAEVPTYDEDARAHAFNEGKRAAYLEILHGLRLDQRRLAALSRQLREAEDDDE